MSETLTLEIALKLASNLQYTSFHRKKDEIAGAMITSPKACYDAGVAWSDKKFRLLRDTLVEGVSKDPTFAYAALELWRESRIVYTARPLVESLSRNTECSFEVFYSWTNEIKLMLFKKYTPRSSDAGLLLQLNKEDADLIKRVYTLAEDNGANKEFHTHWPTVLKEDNLHRWAETIIEHFQKDTIGGDTYRIA
jgi:hypothetical protein